MFTGIIQELGSVESAARGATLRLAVKSTKVAKRLKTGDSVSINGVCQTVVEAHPDIFVVEAVEETLSRTNLGLLSRGDSVNLEAPMGTEDMFHGHFVQGHIDCTGRLIAVSPREGSFLTTVEYPEKYSKYLIEKGSIAVDGISLTVVESTRTAFSIAVIPHTLENTVLKYRKTGDLVNLEFDMMAKFIEKLISGDKKEKLTLGFLKEHGFG